MSWNVFRLTFWLIYYAHHKIWLLAPTYTLMFLSPFVLNDLLHTLQACGYCPLCMRRCFFRTPLWMNDLLHTLQEYGRTALCMPWCTFRTLLSLNDLLHTSHVYGHSPLCMRWCLFRQPLWRNDFYIHHRHTDACHYVCIDVPSDDYLEWMIYYTRHRNVAAHHYVCVDVSSGHPF
jgi:hypothetical protein